MLLDKSPSACLYCQEASHGLLCGFDLATPRYIQTVRSRRIDSQRRGRPDRPVPALDRTARTLENVNACTNPIKLRRHTNGSVRSRGSRTATVGLRSLSVFHNGSAARKCARPTIRRRRSKRHSNQHIGAARHPRWPRGDSWIIVIFVWGRVRRVTPHNRYPSKYGCFSIRIQNVLHDIVALERGKLTTTTPHLPNTCQWARNHPPSHASALRTSIWWQSDILAVAPPLSAFPDILRPRHDPGQPSGGPPRHRRRASW